MSGRRPCATGAAAGALLVALTAPAPAAAARQVGRHGPLLDPTAPLVALLALAAWGLAGWLLLAVLVTAGSHLPGLAGRVLAATARRTAPAVVRHAVEVALGISLAVGAAGASTGAVRPPAAGPGDPTPAASLPSLDWPAAAAAPAQPRRGRATPPSSAPQVVVVRPGDSLWRLAERDLLAVNAATPTPGEVAQAWPTWWAANRAAIGDDPDLIHPGTRLTRPATP